MKFLKPAEEDFSLQIINLVDVVLVLLIFFMVTTSYVGFASRLDIQLPDAKAGAAAGQKRSFTIEISGEGKIFLDGKESTKEEISTALRQPAGAKSSVIIRADKRLFYGLAVEIMGICRSAGINDIGLAVI